MRDGRELPDRARQRGCLVHRRRTGRTSLARFVRLPLTWKCVLEGDGRVDGRSAMLQLREGRQWSLFVGQWVAPLRLLGVYNKIVAGSDRTQQAGRAGSLVGGAQR